MMREGLLWRDGKGKGEDEKQMELDLANDQSLEGKIEREVKKHMVIQ